MLHCGLEILLCKSHEGVSSAICQHSRLSVSHLSENHRLRRPICLNFSTDDESPKLLLKNTFLGDSAMNYKEEIIRKWKPCVIFINGLPGVGKLSVARMIKEMYVGLAVVNTSRLHLELTRTSVLVTAFC